MLNYMAKVEKKQKDPNLTEKALMDAKAKRAQGMEIKPKLNLALKIAVAELPIKEQGHAQEVAETLEEMLQAVCKGQTKLPPRATTKPG